MASEGSTLIERLYRAEDPCKLHVWKEGYYVSMCRLSADDVPSLIELVKRWPDPNWPDDAELPQSKGNERVMLPVTAWRALGDMQAAAAVEPLIEMLRNFNDGDDWVFEDLPPVFGRIGEPAILPLTCTMQDPSQPELVRQIAAAGLRSIALRLPATRDRIVGSLTEQMAKAADNSITLNTYVLCELLDLNAAEAAEPIERAYAQNLIDVGMNGEWETVRKELGVEGLGLGMPEHPFNTIDRLRAGMGIGVFSQKPLFSSEGIVEEAERAYYETAESAFSASEEAREVASRCGDLGWYQLFLSFGVGHLGEVVDEMSLASVKRFVLGHVPKSVSVDADEAESIVVELTAFWQFLKRIHQLPEADSIIAWLTEPGLIDELTDALSDPSNFGIAKSFYMTGKQAGYDMDSEQDRAAFMDFYHGSLSRMTPSAPRHAGDGIGRNDACPCGSGKKFKKCCGRRG